MAEKQGEFWSKVAPKRAGGVSPGISCPRPEPDRKVRQAVSLKQLNKGK